MAMTTQQPGNPGAAAADFEKWIKMASDNKINTSNSWDLALIDYFYDLSMLRDAGGINFQKASATLDGCVKIYSSRVDSAVTETGRLLNGLSTSKVTEIEDEDEDEGEIDADAPTRQRKNRISSDKDTLVDFGTIKARKVDLELHVDPLFKKVLTDFDEGGAKSLLMNLLSVDKNQKIIFGAADITDAESGQSKRRNSILNELEDDDGMDIDNGDLGANDTVLSTTDPTLDVRSLGSMFFNSYSDFESLSVCPSVGQLKAVLNSETTPTDLLAGLEQANVHNYYAEANQMEKFQEDGFGDDISFGEALDDIGPLNSEDPNGSKYPGNRSSIFFNDLEDDTDHYGSTIRDLFNEEKSFSVLNEEGEENAFPADVTSIPDENLMAYFDQNVRNNWAGQDHWRVTRLKDFLRKKEQQNYLPSPQDNETPLAKKPRKKREPTEKFCIDFLSDEYPDEDVIFEPEHYSINLPKRERESTDTHVLPVDLHYTARYFVNLFQKEKLINSIFKKSTTRMDDIIDQSLYADLNTFNEPQTADQDDNQYDLSFGDGDGFEDADDFGPSIPSSTQATQFSSQFTQRNGLNYSRVAKKVDIKLLKDNIWEALSEEVSSKKSIIPPPLADSSAMSEDSVKSGLPAQETLKFSDIVHDVGDKYGPESKKDLSTSFCFICLLHLANENGFTIDNNSDNTDLIIKSVDL